MSGSSLHRRAVCQLPVLVLMVTALGCQSASRHTTGAEWTVSDEFSGTKSKHMSLVWPAQKGEPMVELVLCERRPATSSAGRDGELNIHVVIYSDDKQYDLKDHDLQFLADGQRIALSESEVRLSPAVWANFHISVQQLRELRGSQDLRVRINTVGAMMVRQFEQAHRSALAAFCSEVVNGEGG